ncbi:MAG: GerMN domain-containing protein [Bacilli bacterium]
MLKRIGLRKIGVTSLAFIIIGIIYFFPSFLNTTKIESSVIYKEDEKLTNVYLLDKYNYITSVSVNIDKESNEEIIREKIEYLIKNGKKNDNVPNGFSGIIPINTVLKNVSISKNSVTLDFSKELNNVLKKDAEKMIEAIVYTSTSLEEITSVYLSVEGKDLLKIPNTNKTLDKPLTRDFGINKLYDISNLTNLNSTTVYYCNQKSSSIYYTPVTLINNDDREKISVIIDELKSSVVYQANLESYLNASAELKNYEIINDIMYLTFNDKIFDTTHNNQILEEVKYTISMSVKDNYDVSSVVFKVGEKEVAKSELKE